MDGARPESSFGDARLPRGRNRTPDGSSDLCSPAPRARLHERRVVEGERNKSKTVLEAKTARAQGDAVRAHKSLFVARGDPAVRRVEGRVPEMFLPPPPPPARFFPLVALGHGGCG